MVDDIKVGKSWFVKTQEGKINEIYSFKDKTLLGEGSYGKVTKAIHRKTNQERAVKVIPKHRVKDKKRFLNEIEILRTVDHPNIIKLYETYEDATYIFLVMELCTGGELLDRIITKTRLSESEARKIFRQIMLSINYCHANSIVHRDLKPENFLFLTESEDSPIKLIDFGLSKMYQAEKTDKRRVSPLIIQSKVGSAYYIAPEVLNGEYNELCDVWSAGVILFTLLCGYPPFNGQTDKEILLNVKKGEYEFDEEEWGVVSDKAKDLIKKMLVKTDERLTAEKVLAHEWLQISDNPSEDEKPLNLNINALKSFRNAERLKKVALTYIATQLSANEISELNKLFVKFDTNCDGILSYQEMKAGIDEMKGKAPMDLENILQSIDTDKNGAINYTAASIEKNIYLKEDKLLQAFSAFDKDGNGKISALELQEVLQKDETLKDDIEIYKQMIQEADLDGDGEIDYSEFIKMMTGTQTEDSSLKDVLAKSLEK